MISGERVKQAREFRGLTQTELARHIGVTQSLIAQIEGDLKPPSEAVLQAIALKTGFPLSFFRQGPPPDFRLGSLLFRSQASVTSRERSRVFRFAQLIYEIVEILFIPQLKRPMVHLPKLGRDVSIKEAASLTRDALSVPQGLPIANLTNVVEKAGVIIFMLPTPIEKGDAFSAWIGVNAQTPFIVLGAGRPGDRVRLSVAHEIGELVLHHALDGRRLDEIEREAFQFAAELLMPEETIREEIVSPVTLSHLARLKPRWKVSIQALIKRAHDLEIVTTRQYTYLFEQLSSMGWRQHEPDNLNVPVEQPRGLRKMAEVLYGNPPNYERLANDAHRTVSFIRKIIEAQAEATSSRASSPSKVVPLSSKRKAH